MTKISIDGMEINYCIDDLTDPWREPETVQTILMHHGFSRNHKFWTPWVATLARYYRVIRHDAPGFGESTIPDGTEMNPSLLVSTALKLIDALEINQVHWIGSQSGGMMGQLFAASHPERIRSLTLVNSPYKLSEEHEKALSAGYKNSVEAVEKLGVAGWRAKTMETSVDTRKADPRMMEWTITEMGKTLTKNAVSLQRTFANADLSENLNRIKCPTLIMNGDKAVCVTPEMMTFMYRQIPNSRIRMFSNIAGSVDMVIPDQCAKAALEFIMEIDGMRLGHVK